MGELRGPNAASKDNQYRGRCKLNLAVVGLLTTLAIACGVSSLHAEAQSRSPWTPPGMYVSVGNHNLHINCVGGGSPTVIFESGLGGTSLDWARVHPQVATFTRSCSYDRAGYGWSESGPLPRHAGQITRELATLLTYASVPPPYILVAHSFGGFPARLFAHEFPEKVAGLVLVDTTHEQQFKRFNAGANRPLVPRGRSFIIANYWEVADGLPDDLKTLARSLALRPRSVRALYAEMADMRLSAVQVMDRPILPDVPVHVVARQPRVGAQSAPNAGQASERRWQEAQRDLAARIPNAQFHLAKGSGHHVQLDAPALVVDLIRAVVDETRSHANANGSTTGCLRDPRRPLLTGIRGGLGYRTQHPRERHEVTLAC